MFGSPLPITPFTITRRLAFVRLAIVRTGLNTAPDNALYAPIGIPAKTVEAAVMSL